MASSRKWAILVSFIASRLYFAIIVFQVPLFRVPCRTGICTTPIEVTSTHLFASEVLPISVVKCLLYPGAIARAAIKNKPIPRFDSLLSLYNFTNFKKSSSSNDLYLLEVLAGCYLCVAGALLGSSRTGRISFFGMLLLLWGLSKEVFFKNPNDKTYMRAFHIYPSMAVALVVAFLSIRKDVKKIVLSFKPKKH